MREEVGEKIRKVKNLISFRIQAIFIYRALIINKIVVECINLL